MDITLYLAFLAVAFGLILVPGPNVIMIVSTSVAHGPKRGLQTVAGTSVAMTLQLSVVAIGTAWFVKLIADGLFYLKWIGVAYLFFLGLRQLKTSVGGKNQDTDITAPACFTRGFLISLTNPKTMLFFLAFLPQFVSTSGNYNLQMLLLSLSFLVMAVALDSCYALLAAKLTNILKKRYMNSFQNGISGLMYLGASAWLALAKRSS